MKDVYPDTANEKLLVAEIQRKAGALDNGVIGCETLVKLLHALGIPFKPFTLIIYGKPVIVAKDIIPVASNGKPVKDYANCISGSFTWPSGKTPCSILVKDGKAVNDMSCHAHLKKPETVIYKRKSDGKIMCGRYTQITPGMASELSWAIGGMGLLDNYSPATEGFTGDYADVLRKTNHTALGVKGGLCFLCYMPNMTASEINNHFKTWLKLDMAVMLDGGHLAAINGTESFAKLNTSQQQGYLIQGI